MLDLGRIDLEEIAIALVDRTDYEHRWLIDPARAVGADASVRYTATGVTGRIRRLTGNQGPRLG